MAVYVQWKGIKMKLLLMLIILLVIAVPGCTQYAAIDNVRTGMTVDELIQIETPCYCSGKSDESLTYNCDFKVPGGLVKPYILTFKDGKLAEIAIDQKELDRRQIRDRFYYGDRYYLHYGYPFYYGYPYRYGYGYYYGFPYYY